MNSTDISAPFLIYGGHFNFVTSNENATTAFRYQPVLTAFRKKDYKTEVISCELNKGLGYAMSNHILNVAVVV